jgi:hypothetical protein
MNFKNIPHILSLLFNIQRGHLTGSLGFFGKSCLPWAGSKLIYVVEFTVPAVETG